MSAASQLGLIVAGDAAALSPLILLRGGVAVVLTGGTVECKLCAADRSVLIDWTAVNSGDAGNDFAAGTIVPRFSALATAAMVRGMDRVLYIRVTGLTPTPETWRDGPYETDRNIP